MISVDLSPIANHLWQSSLCVAGVWLLTLGLRTHRAAARYWLWLSASVKFLIPFSWLAAIGGQSGWQPVPATFQPQMSTLMSDIERPFAIAAFTGPVSPSTYSLGALPAVLLAIWLCGVLLGLLVWVRSVWRMRAIERAARPLDLKLTIPVRCSTTRMEPGVFGILKPVLLIPEGIADHLTDEQLEAVLAHELCHVRRKDNLTAAIHLVVEMIFWFHPMVWWIRRQLIAERERACDEAVAGSTADPQVYAEAILKVCRFYLALPPGCASGVTGANLKERIVEIMAERTILDLTRGKRVLLVGTLLAAMVLPVAVGIVGAQPQRPEAFDVSSVKLNTAREKGSYPGLAPGGQRFAATNLPLMALIVLAYDVSPAQISGVPDILTRESYDVEGKCDRPMTKEQSKRMLQTLLADRFKLVIRREAREQQLYELVVAKNGPKLRENTEEGLPMMRRNGPGESRTFQRTPMSTLTLILSQQVDRHVVDKTGLTGKYDFNLSYWLDRPGSIRAPGDGGPPPASEGLPSVFTALQEQVGLKLESRKGPVEYIVVDHAERPTGN